jgi:hypothetical protein
MAKAENRDRPQSDLIQTIVEAASRLDLDLVTSLEEALEAYKWLMIAAPLLDSSVLTDYWLSLDGKLKELGATASQITDLNLSIMDAAVRQNSYNDMVFNYTLEELSADEAKQLANKHGLEAFVEDRFADWIISKQLEHESN